MARAKGTVKYGLNLEVQTPAPLDARSLVPTKADLILADTWVVAPSTQAYTYTGMLVVVASDPTTTNNGIYMLKSRTGWADPEQWSKLSSETVFSITGLNITGLYNETPDHVYMKADVVSVDGSLYYCLVDNTTNVKPIVTTDWQLNWALFQLRGSEGAAGATPTIGNNGNWFINGVDQLKKAIGENGITPNIQDGFWYIGNDKQGKATGTQITVSADGYWVLDGVKSTTLALGLQGQSAIANINYLGTWKTNTQYYKSDRNGKTDVVVGSDETMYAALVDSRNINPVSDTLRNTWVVFSMRGIAGKQGDTPYIEDGYWWIGTERKDVKAAGDVLSISSEGFWQINGVTTNSKAVPENGQNGTNGTNGTNGENAVANINVRGPWLSGQTYLHLNEDETTDVVLGSNGTSYFCLQDTSIDPTTDTTNTYWAQFSMAGSPGITPHIELDPDGEYRWYIGTQNQNIIAQGKNGTNGINGRNASQPYITEQGFWGYKLLMPDGTYQYNTTTVVAEGLTPYIKEGFWWIGNRNTGVQAIGQSAIANLNYVGEWLAGTPYYHVNPTANNWTDVVLGADDNSYYCKTNSTDKNPCKLVDNVWVRDEANAQYWAKFVMKGTATDGRNIELHRNEGWLQWRVVGEGNDEWKNLVELKTLVSQELSDISTPIGSVLMYSGSPINLPIGYLLANGATIQKTEYPELVEVLSGSNTAVSATLPDLRERFIVGYSDNGNSPYDMIGHTGGLKEVRLTGKQSGTSKHSHGTGNVNLPYFSIVKNTQWERADEMDETGRVVSYDYNEGNRLGTTTKTGDSGYLDAEIAHENLPPYYVLAYIVKGSYIGEIKTPYDTYLQTLAEGVTPLTKEQWLETMKGEIGIAGINPRGNYINTTPYYDHDTVVIVNEANPENGNSFSCIVEGETGVTGVEPGITAGWENSWARLVLRGAKGPAAPQVLIRYSESSSTAEGSDWHATPTLSDIYARFSTDGAVSFGSPIQFKGGKGDDAFPIKIQYSITGAGDWSDTATATSKYLRFSTDNGLVWSNVITIQGGSSVFTSDIQANLPSGRYIGKYAYNALIPSNGKTFEEVLRDIVTDSISPTATVSASGSIPYNDAGLLDRNITVTMNASSNNSGASITERKLYYRRVGDSTWIELKNQPGNSDITAAQTTYIHNVKDLIAANNVKGFEYKLTVKDSLNATKEATSNAVTPAGYSGASYTISAFSETKEKGDVAKSFTGSISQTAQNGVQVVSYELQYRIDGGSWVQFAYQSYATAPVMPITLGITTSAIENTIRNANTVEYRLLIISTSATGNQTATITLGTTTLVYKNAFGYSASASPTLATLLAMGNNSLTNAKAKTVTATAPAGNYTYYAYCAEAGDLSGIVMDGVAAVLGAFSKQADITGTNSFGATVTYRVYKSNAPAAFTNNQLVIS